MKIYILILLIIFPLVSAHKIGVSPSKLEMESQSEIYVINSNNFETKFKLSSQVVNFNEESFILQPDEKRKISVRQKSKKDGIIEILSGENLVSSLHIPVKFKQNNNNITKQEIINENETKGLFLIVIFNLIGLAIGALVWKKKIFWPSQ